MHSFGTVFFFNSSLTPHTLKYLIILGTYCSFTQNTHKNAANIKKASSDVFNFNAKYRICRM